MTNVKLVKFKFKPGKKEVWLNWAEELKRRRDEVVATLKNEGVVSECCFISESGEFLYYFMEAGDFEKVRNTSFFSSHPIDHGHRKALRESLERVADLECLFHFENRD